MDKIQIEIPMSDFYARLLAYQRFLEYESYLKKHEDLLGIDTTYQRLAIRVLIATLGFWPTSIAPPTRQLTSGGR
jgi:hypothetical protein